MAMGNLSAEQLDRAGDFLAGQEHPRLAASLEAGAFLVDGERDERVLLDLLAVHADDRIQT